MSLDRRILALGFARLADAFGNALLIVVLPLYVTSSQVTGSVFGFSTAVISGIVLALFGVFDSLVQPFAGRWSDRLSRRRVFILAGLLVLAVTNAAFVVSSSYLGLFAIRIVQGLGVGITVTASVALINEYSSIDNRGMNFGLFHALRLVGFGAGPLVAGFLVSEGPYRLNGIVVDGFAASFDTATIAAVVGFVLVTTYVHEPETTSTAAAKDLSLQVFDRTGGLTLCSHSGLLLCS